MPKIYVKVITPGGKSYKALINGKRSNRSFKTATQAEKYAARWKARYQKLKLAEIEMKEFEDVHREDEVDGEMMYCQGCGCIYVTYLGDLFCRDCAREIDEEDERRAEEEQDYYPEPYDECAWEDEA